MSLLTNSSLQTLSVETPYEYFKHNPIKFGKHYFPNHFRDISPEFHFKILSESYAHRFFAVQAPRGSAKSTILSFLKPTHSICFKMKRFIVIVQNTYKKAVGTLLAVTCNVGTVLLIALNINDNN